MGRDTGVNYLSAPDGLNDTVIPQIVEHMVQSEVAPGPAVVVDAYEHERRGLSSVDG